MPNSDPRPVIAIVGRPNVGKSALFNRLVGRRRSIVADTPGVTRDRIYSYATLSSDGKERNVIFVDTGGFDPETDDPRMFRVLEQTQLAIEEADVILVLVDGQVGPLSDDWAVVDMVRKAGKRFIIGVNKADNPKNDIFTYPFLEMGVPDTIAVSAAHGRNVGELVEVLLAGLPEQEPAAEGEAHEPEEESDAIRVAVVGRPNVGKSSLVNRLLGEDRHLVSDMPGTTVDTVDSLIEAQGQAYVFMDTAGLRRKQSLALTVERFSVFQALKGLERSDVALLLLDASEDLARQDARVSSFAYERGRAVVLVVTKWDLMRGITQKAFIEKVRQAMPHLSYAPIVFTSSRTGAGLEKMFPAIRRVHKAHGQRVTTGRLNKFLEQLVETNPPPADGRRRGRIYYLTQIGVRPPRFLVSVNNPAMFHFSYRRFLVNELRRQYAFEGVPLLVGYRSHRDEEAVTPKGSREKGQRDAAVDPRKQATKVRRARKVERRVKNRKKTARNTPNR
jgi:GTPase